jgi:hypothetical protein
MASGKLTLYYYISLSKTNHVTQLLFDFFHALDEETGEPTGVPIDVLKSPRYHDIQSLYFFYFEPTEHLIRESERMASAYLARAKAANNSRLSAPPSSFPASGSAAFASMRGTMTARRTKSIMVSRNIGTMRKAKEEKRKEAQAEASDDMILRILRMKPEAAGYLKERSRQKQNLAAAAEAEMIVKRSLQAGAGRMAPTIGQSRR